MTFQIQHSTIEFASGNIVDQDVDAIVNAANARLLAGSGVCGAIHRAAGPELVRACEKIGYCATGSAVMTPGFRLKARYVIHAVGPIYQGQPDAAELLAGAYRSSLELAVQQQLSSIAFPSISTGVYGYPLEQAAPIALQTMKTFLEAHKGRFLVRIMLFDPPTTAVYQQLAPALLHSENKGEKNL
jgi:O-acetyl-ADP-ribose deacetylase (regulator of RNase III)